MRNQIVSPYFEESEYKGQDVVHYGIRIPLRQGEPEGRPQRLLEKFSRRAQRIVKDHYQDLTYRPMTDADLALLRNAWFDPKDPTYPDSMEGRVGIVAYWLDKPPYDGDSGQNVVGGIVLTPQGANLFVHQLIATEHGREMQAPTLLIWEAVRRFTGQYHSIDVGVSYNPKRYEFFQNFAVETYPIIVKKPFYVPVIRLSPFRSFEDALDKPQATQEDVENANMTFLPRGNYALYAALRHAGVGPGDQVNIVKTFGSRFITGCVTKTIEKTGATWKLRDLIRQGTKAIVAIHEFGIPIFQKQDMEILDHARDLGIPVIEDCAWRTTKVWDWSQYGVFSMQKMTNVNYGGYLQGARIPDEVLWSWGCLDTVKREAVLLEKDALGPEQRVANWTHYHSLVLADGMTPDDCYPYEDAVKSGWWLPTVYLQRFESEDIAKAIVARLEEFGIQAGMYWGEPVVYLPIHQNMSKREVEYMFAVVRGYFNLCRDYK